MSLTLFDFRNPRNIKIFWITVALSSLLLFTSSILLYAKYKEEKDIEDQIHIDNEASIFVAPQRILDPLAIFKPIDYFEDTLPFEDSELPPAVAPENILNPQWAGNFSKPSMSNL